MRVNLEAWGSNGAQMRFSDETARPWILGVFFDEGVLSEAFSGLNPSYAAKIGLDMDPMTDCVEVFKRRRNDS